MSNRSKRMLDIVRQQEINVEQKKRKEMPGNHDKRGLYAESGK